MPETCPMLRPAANTHTWQVREAVAAKISIQLRARAGTGSPETLTFSYMTGGEQDAPVELRIGDTLYRLDRDDLLAFARAIGGKV
jgi:hypothetical protein